MHTKSWNPGSILSKEWSVKKLALDQIKQLMRF